MFIERLNRQFEPCSRICVLASQLSRLGKQDSMPHKQAICIDNILFQRIQLRRNLAEQCSDKFDYANIFFWKIMLKIMEKYLSNTKYKL
jgi:hypothetical protein